MSSSTLEAAFALLQQGRIAEAEAAARAAVQSDPASVDALHLMGLVLARAGKRDEALAFLDRALERSPRHAELLKNRAVVFSEAGRLEEAERDLRRALQAQPRFCAVLCLLGSVLHRQGRLEEARAAYRRALAVDPGEPSANYNLGTLHLAAGELAQALALLERAVARSPGHADALGNLGLALLQAGRDDEAIAAFASAVAADPACATALNNWGNALKERGELEEAAALLDRAIAAAPAFAEALNNRAGVALEAGDLEGAEHFASRAALVNPRFAEARMSLAQVALRRRDFERGWEGFEARFETDPPLATWRPPALPRFERADLGAGLRVAVWREQGVGDQLLFATLLPELAATGARPVVELDARLVGLFRRNHPGIAFVGPEESAAAFAACDRQLPLGSLPRLLRAQLAHFDRQPQALLRAQAQRVRAIRERLGPGRWVAVSWRSFQGRGQRLREQRKSMPVEKLSRLLAIPGVRLLDLQYGDVAAERAAFEAAHPGALTSLEGLDLFNDFEGVLAAIEACEALASVSNVTAHLAGVAGRRAWVMFTGARAPFHYWSGAPGSRSLWYPAVEIATDPASGQWEGVVDAVARALAK